MKCAVLTHEDDEWDDEYVEPEKKEKHAISNSLDKERLIGAS